MGAPGGLGGTSPLGLNQPKPLAQPGLGTTPSMGGIQPGLNLGVQPTLQVQ